MNNTTERYLSYLQKAQTYFGKQDYKNSLMALLKAEGYKKPGYHEDLDAISDDLMDILIRKLRTSNEIVIH